MSTHCCDERTHEELIRTIREQADPGWCEDLCRCVPLLVELLEEMHGEPTDHHRSAIRAVLVEHCRVGPAGHPASLDERPLHRHVDLMLDTLEGIRRQRLDAGLWSEMPVPPQCFG